MMLPILKTSWPGLLDNFLSREELNGFHYDAGLGLTPAVNIFESKADYTIQVAAPGFEKEDFKIKLENKLLTISSDKKSEHDEQEGKYWRKEFKVSSFKRTFSLPETVDADNISANYQKGILSLNVPKKEEAKVKPVRQIEIA